MHPVQMLTEVAENLNPAQNRYRPPRNCLQSAGCEPEKMGENLRVLILPKNMARTRDGGQGGPT